MNFKKYLLITSIALAITTRGAVVFNASEVNTTSDIVSNEALFAPVHPTKEQVQTASATDLVTFNDSSLEQAISEELSVPVGEITVGDMESLTYLNFSMKEIRNLTGLEYATNLTHLDLYDNNISDLSPLSGLANLTYLNVDYNNVSDLSPLNGLTNLNDLNLYYNKISDLSPLSGLTNLSNLDLYDNQISDISPLSGLTNLETLTLSDNKVSDLSPLSGLTNIDILALDYNQISDISPLSEMTDLTYLNLGNNNISDISSLSEMTDLTYLNLDTNNISDISPLSGLTNLTYLSMSFNNISDVSPLSEITDLNYLNLYFNHISDISPLSGLTNLTFLSTSNQTISLGDITVSSNDEIFYTITDIDGNEHQVSIGVPNDGTNYMSGTWFVDTSIEIGGAPFNGYISQTVTYDTSSALTGIDTAETFEETTLTDEDLVLLFAISSSSDSNITVNQSSVDYSAPGAYEVIFNDEDGNEFIGTLSITDILPELNVDKDTVTVEVGGTLDDILAMLNYTASEITAGDLTDLVNIDDTNIDYSIPGQYELLFSVSDEEGNSVDRTVTVVIEDDLVDPKEPELPDETESEPVESETKEIGEPELPDETESEIDNVKEMTLSKTGGNDFVIVLASVILLVLVSMRKYTDTL